jgi:hypothetical protein
MSSPRTTARRIDRVANAWHDMTQRDIYTLVTLTGYLSERAAKAGEPPRTIRVAVFHYRVAESTQNGIVHGVDIATGEERTYILDKASRVSDGRKPTRKEWTRVLTARARREARIAATGGEK